jgi:ParB family transcriptional regulator, chromosome partitioning protein
MARRRLGPAHAADIDTLPGAPHREDVPRAEHRAEARPGPAAPIARVAADAASASALEELAETLRAAREDGRLLLDLPLDAVAPDHLARDRLPGPDEDMGALVESIRIHGQRSPIEVTPLAGPLPYGLISGWRRLAALQALHAETGAARFATVRALVTRPESAGAAYVAMVEENEIRLGLSYYERARVAALATRRGVFPTEKAALLALFATASRPKRSRIRSFLAIVHALDGALRFPQAIPERLGLRLAERLRSVEGEGARIAAALAAAAPATPEDECAFLHRLVAPAPAPAREPGPEEILPGVTLAARRRGATLTLTLKGRGVTPAFEAEIRAALARLAPA